MLFLVGTGLGSIHDLSLKGCEVIRNSDYVYLESYTSVMSVGIDEYCNYFGKNIILADRELIEENSDQIISQAKEEIVSLIVIGDPLGATTHADLLQRCVQLGVPYKIIHNTSILVAVAECGLQLYKFGETVSIVTWTDNWKPDSFYDKIVGNYCRGLHTLCLLDIKLNERNIEKMIKKIKEYDPPFFLSARRASQILLEITSTRSQNIQDNNHKETQLITGNTKCVVMGRVGWPDQIIYTTTLEKLACNDSLDQNCPQSLIIPSQITEYELEFLKIFSTEL